MVLPYPMTLVVKRPGTFLLFREIGKICCMRRIICLEPLPLELALMFVFLILDATAGGWTVEVCTACPANTVLAALQIHSAMNDVVKDDFLQFSRTQLYRIHARIC